MRLLEEEGFHILDMCLLEIKPIEYENFMKSQSRPYEAIEVTLVGQGRCALFAVSHKSDEIFIHGGRVERGSKATFFPGEAAVWEWFGALQK